MSLYSWPLLPGRKFIFLSRNISFQKDFNLLLYYFILNPKVQKRKWPENKKEDTSENMKDNYKKREKIIILFLNETIQKFSKYQTKIVFPSFLYKKTKREFHFLIFLRIKIPKRFLFSSLNMKVQKNLIGCFFS